MDRRKVMMLAVLLACSAGLGNGAQCQVCDAGTFCFDEHVGLCPTHSVSPRGSDDVADCVCAAGYHMFLLEVGRECRPCEAGKYCPGDNTQHDCPGDSESPPMSTEIADCVCKEGFTTTDGDACVACAAGKYKASVSDVACSGCPVDTYQPATGATALADCDACPANTVALEESVAVTACVANVGYHGSPGVAAVACAKGQYQDEIGKTACKECSDVGNTWSDTVAATSAATCEACPANTVAVPARAVQLTDCKCVAGYTGPDGGACAACAAGTYKAGVGAQACDLCGENTFSTATAATSSATCVPCTGNSHSAAGSDERGDCTCNSGFEPQGAPGEACVACEPGYTSVDAAACSACAAGSYSTSTTSCALCTPLSHSPAASFEATACLCNAGAYGAAGGPCALCEAGTYAAAAAQTACVDCGVGTYEDGTGSTACAGCPAFSTTTGEKSTSIAACDCNAGYEGQSGACSACGEGFFHDTATTACAACAADTYQDTPASTACVDCPFQQASAEASDDITDCECNAGYTGVDGQPCAACQAGTYKGVVGEHARDFGSVPCLACSAGKFSLTAATVCTLCGEGKFQESSGQSACEDCRANSELLSTGGTAALQCECVAGFYLLGAACEVCGYGDYKTGTSNDACASCGAGKYTEQTGSTAEEQCLTCAADRYTDGGQCHPCPANSQTGELSVGVTSCACNTGYTGPDGGACSACPAGTFKDSVGTAACTPCAAGTVSTVVAASEDTCVACPVDSYRLDTTECLSCPANSVSEERSNALSDCKCNVGFSGPDGGACAACAAGFYKNVTGSAACTLCPFGTYNPSTASDAPEDCQQCPQLTTQVTAAPYVAEASCVCVAGYTRDSTSGSCVECAFGSFKPLPGDHACTPCPAGTFYPSSVPGSNRVHDMCTLCPARSSSDEGSGGLALCVCEPGTQRSIEFSIVNCTFCEPNFYCPDETTQTACPEHSFSRERSSSIADCECVAGYYGASGVCQICPVGSYCPQSATAALACAANSSTVGQQGQAECTCLPGYFALSPYLANSECAPCPPNSFCYLDDKTSCPGNSTAVARSDSRMDCLCHPGFARSGGDADFTCEECSADMLCVGGHAAAVQCVAGALSNNTLCLCHPGTYCEGGAASCSVEEAGAACVECPANYYCNLNRKTLCPDGMTTEPGESDNAACQCGAGHYRDHGLCRICPAGAFCPDGEIILCTSLDPHFVTEGTGHASKDVCKCGAGYFRLTGEDACKKCPADFYCPGEYDWERTAVGLPNVAACMANAYSLPGSSTHSSCICDVGFKHTEEGEITKCVRCEIGQRCSGGSIVESGCHEFARVPNADHTKCVCQPGFSEINFECVPCAPGSVKPLAGDALCTWCPANTFWRNGTLCEACPEHSTSAPGSLQCTCAAPRVLEDGSCELCARNEYYAGGVCQQCPARSAAPAGSTGVSACACAKGTFRVHNSNGTECQLCPENTFERNGVCTPCGFNASSPVGSVNSSLCFCRGPCQSEVWTHPVTGIFECRGECVTATPNCRACQPGTAKALPGAGDCTPCPPDFFQPDSAQAACDACPAHESHFQHGRTSIGACKCDPGRYRAAIQYVAHSRKTLSPGGNTVRIMGITFPADFYNMFDVTDRSDNWIPALKVNSGSVVETCKEICSELALRRFYNTLMQTEYWSGLTWNGQYGCVGFTVMGSLCGPIDVATTGANQANTIITAPQAAWTTHGDFYRLFNSRAPGTFNGGDFYYALVPLHYPLCAECAPGSAKPDYGDHECPDCDVGEFQDAAGETACKACARETSSVHVDYTANANTTLDVGSDAISDCVCQPGLFAHAVSPGAAEACQPCVPGSFKELAGNHACDFCGAYVDQAGTSFEHHYGSAAYGTDAQNCVACPPFSGQDPAIVGPQHPMSDISHCLCFPGHTQWSLAGCAECADYLHKTNYSNDPCLPCADGFYFTGKALACEPCDLRDADGGLHALVVANMDNIAVPYGYAESDCDCRPGFERVVDACVECGLGEFRSEKLPRQCQPCPVNFYADSTGTVTCTACPQDSTTLTNGSSSILHCLCDPGFQRNQATLGCDPCPAGTARDGTGSATCEACAVGFFSLAGATACTACGLHETTSGTGSGHPNLCFCEPGFGGTPSHDACQACQPGTFAGGGHASSHAALRRPACESCPAGKNSTARSTAVDDCSCLPGHGTRSAAPLPTDACLACVSGKFSPGSVNKPCLSCGWGAISANASVSIDSCECNANVGVYESNNVQ